MDYCGCALVQRIFLTILISLEQVRKFFGIVHIFLQLGLTSYYIHIMPLRRPTGADTGFSKESGLWRARLARNLRGVGTLEQSPQHGQGAEPPVEAF